MIATSPVQWQAPACPRPPPAVDAINLDRYAPIHWSVWTLASFTELCEHLDLPVLDALDPDDKTGNGFMVALDASGGGA